MHKHLKTFCCDVLHLRGAVIQVDRATPLLGKLLVKSLGWCSHLARVQSIRGVVRSGDSAPARQHWCCFSERWETIARSISEVPDSGLAERIEGVMVLAETIFMTTGRAWKRAAALVDERHFTVPAQACASRTMSDSTGQDSHSWRVSPITGVFAIAAPRNRGLNLPMESHERRPVPFC